MPANTVGQEPLQFGASRPDSTNQQVIDNALKDFKAVLAGKQPVYAKFDNESSTPADGGTQVFKANGYSLVVLKSLVTVAGVDGYMYGPIIRFEPSVAVGNSNTISQVSFYSVEALNNLLSANTR
jgi:hypothetical protein